MAKLHISLIWPGYADGAYAVRAKGAILAELRWADDNGPLAGWGPFGYVPLDPAGNGSFFFPGRRAIPVGATRVHARCVSHDFAAFEEAYTDIPERFLPEIGPDGATRFTLLTDLHLSGKPWRTRRALRAAGSDAILLLGDCANDGYAAQFDGFEDCIREAVGEKVVLSVPGNHDVIHPSIASADGCFAYAAFQARRLADAEAKGFAFERDPDSLAWATRAGGVDVIGLQCVVSGRQFRFPEERQLDWLEDRLSRQGDADWHLILCHAPLLAHNPHRADGQPYLGKNRRLQAIVDGHRRVAFLSGHTHASPNGLKGSAEWDPVRESLYLNCGSVVDTDIKGEGGLMAGDWKDGCVTELALWPDRVEIETRSVRTGVRFPRGYYRFEASNAVSMNEE